jgi:alkylhydroperoxidase family enzyme
LSTEAEQHKGISLPTEYTSRLSVPVPSDDEIRQVMGDSYNPEKTLNVIKMFAGTGDMYEAITRLVRAIFQTSGIDPRAREVIILRSAKILDVPYQWQANAKLAANAGLSEDEIRAMASDGPVSGVDPEYVLLSKATEELSSRATLTDMTLTEMMRRYDQTTCRKLILMISWFNLLGRFLNGCRVPLETTDKIGNKTSPV